MSADDRTPYPEERYAQKRSEWFHRTLLRLPLKSKRGIVPRMLLLRFVAPEPGTLTITGRVAVTTGHLAYACGVSERVIDRSLRDLENLALIHIERQDDQYLLVRLRTETVL